MKKLFMFLILGIFLISFASAVKIDYSPNLEGVEDMTAVVEDTILFNLIKVGEQGTMELKSHKSPKEIKKVGLGNQVTMYYDANFKDAYPEALGDLTFIDMRTGKEVNRNWKFVYWGLEEYESPIYECSENILLNGSINSECLQTGTEIKTREKWLDYNSKDLPKGKIRIGVMVEVKKGDYIDGIWEVQSKKIDKHAAWSPSLFTNLLSWYDAEESSGSLIDSSVNGNDASLVGSATYQQTGIVNYGIQITGTSTTPSNNRFEDSVSMNADTNSIGFWFRKVTAGNGFGFFNNRENSSSSGISISYGEGGNIGCYVNGAGYNPSASWPWTSDTDNHSVVCIYDDLNISLWFDNVNVANGTWDGRALSNTNIDWYSESAGLQASGTYIMDSMFIYNGKALTGLELNELYSEGLGCSYDNCIVVEPIITLLSPEDSLESSNKNITFIGNISEETPLNVSLIIDDTYNETNTSGILGNYTFDKILSEGVHTWNIEACSVNGCANGTARTLTIDTTPFIEFLTPPTLVNYANITQEYIPMKVNVSTLYYENNSFDLYNINGTTFSQFYTNETYDINFTDIPDGHYHYNASICTTTGKCNTTETRHVNHDVTPPEINISSPLSSYDYIRVGQSIDLNFTAIDRAENVSSCWWNYNGTNNSIACVNGTLTSTSFIYEEDNNNITVYSNDTFGNEGSETKTFTYKLLEVNQTYNEETTEGSLETFLANIKLGSGLSIEDAVLFNYNDTQTTGQAFTLGDYEVLRKANLLVPSVSTDTNFTFYWGITLSDDTEVNLSSQNQTVYNLAVDNCSSYTNQLYNFTVVDEEEQTIIPTAVIETALNFYDSTRSELVFNYSMQFEGVNPLTICLNRNITNDTSYSLDLIARYESSEHANEYYNIINSTIDEDTTTEKITLYDLNLTDSTEFQLTFTGADFLPVENALIYVDRQYIQENTFKTVELPKTDYNGQTILHLVRNDVIYNIRIIKDGEVLGNFENIVAFCQDFTIGDCKIELNAFDSVEAIYNYDESLGIIFTNPTYNETSDKITFNFVTEDGSAKTVRLEVTRNDIFGNRSVCNSTLTSSGGTLTCNIDPNLDDSTLKTEIYVDNVLAVSGNVKLDTSNYGVGGYLILFVMAISFILMFSGSKTGVLVSMGVTFIAAISLGLVTGDIIGIGASGLWLIIIIVIGIIKLNNERAQ